MYHEVSNICEKTCSRSSFIFSECFESLLLLRVSTPFPNLKIQLTTKFWRSVYHKKSKFFILNGL